MVADLPIRNHINGCDDSWCPNRAISSGEVPLPLYTEGLVAPSSTDATNVTYVATRVERGSSAWPRTGRIHFSKLSHG